MFDERHYIRTFCKKSHLFMSSSSKTWSVQSVHCASVRLYACMAWMTWRLSLTSDFSSLPTAMLSSTPWCSRLRLTFSIWQKMGCIDGGKIKEKSWTCITYVSAKILMVRCYLVKWDLLQNGFDHGASRVWDRDVIGQWMDRHQNVLKGLLRVTLFWHQLRYLEVGVR